MSGRGNEQFLVHLADIAAGILALLVCIYGWRGMWQYVTASGSPQPDFGSVVTVVVCGSAWQLILRIARRCSIREPSIIQYEFWFVGVSVAAGSMCLSMFALAGSSSLIRLKQVAQFGVAGLVLLVLNRIVASVLWIYFEKSHPKRSNCIIVGSGSRALAIYRHLQNSPSGIYNVVGFVDELGPHFIPAEIRSKIVCSISGLRTTLMHTAVDEVFLALPVRSCYNQIQTAIHVCEEAGVMCKLPSDLFSCSLATIRVEDQGARSLLSMHVVRSDSTRFEKALIDRAVSAFSLALLFVPMFAIGAAIRLSSPGPAIFVQWRYGLNKRLFKMYKFRTMHVDAEQMQAQLERRNEMKGPVFKMRNDPRITSLGRFLRKTSIDELPQLWNVLIGDMSLVGPRPLPIRDVSRFNEASMMRRFSVKPGLTCLWQISGRSETTFERWMELDLEYIDRCSLWLDVEILAKTIPVVLRGVGAV